MCILRFKRKHTFLTILLDFAFSGFIKQTACNCYLFRPAQCLYNVKLNINEYIKTYSNILEKNNDNEDINNSIAMCYLKLKFYDKAIQHFDKALDSNVDNSDIYFYYAIALLNGKKPFLTPLTQIKRIIELLNAAIMLENKAIYHYFLAYIKYDFYERKNLNMTPNYLDEYNTVKNNISKNEIITLFEVLGQKIPDVIEV